MPLLRSIRLFNAIEDAGYTSATLETLLADQGRKNDMDAIAGDLALMRRLAEVPQAAGVVLGSARGRASIFASSVAMETLLVSRRGRAAVFDTPVVMSALAASATGMQTIGDSAKCKMALSESNAALAAVLASTTALDTLRAAPGYAVVPVVGTSLTELPLALPGARYIALGASASEALNMSVTLKTVTASSGSNVITWNAAAPPGTTALAQSAAIGLKDPFTQKWSQGGKTGYIGLLRCDI